MKRPIPQKEYISWLDCTQGVVPLAEWQTQSAHSLNVWSAFLFDMGMKLRSGGATQAQVDRYNNLRRAYMDIKDRINNNYCLEAESINMMNTITRQFDEIKSLKAEVEKLTQSINFGKD